MRKISLALTMAGLFSCAAHAQLAEQPGLGGEISINLGSTTSTSHFNVDGDKRIDSIDKKASKESGVLVAPLGSIRYTFGDQLNHQVYLGTSREDIAVGTLAFEIGYRHQLSSGIELDFSILPTVMAGETWRNPYQTGVNRQETDEDGVAYRAQVKNLLDGKLALDFAIASKNIEHDDLAGSDLARDGSSYFAKAEYRIALAQTQFLIPAISYLSHDADGEAASHQAINLDISLFTIINRHRIALTAGIKKREYDRASSLFGKVRDDQQISAFAAYEYQNIFDWEHWSFVSFAGFGSTDSNLNFYDEQESIIAVGFNRSF